MGGGRPRGYPGTAGGREAAGAAQAARAAAQRRVETVGTPSEQPLVHTSTSGRRLQGGGGVTQLRTYGRREPSAGERIRHQQQQLRGKKERRQAVAATVAAPGRSYESERRQLERIRPSLRWWRDPQTGLVIAAGPDGADGPLSSAEGGQAAAATQDLPAAVSAQPSLEADSGAAVLAGSALASSSRLSSGPRWPMVPAGVEQVFAGTEVICYRPDPHNHAALKQPPGPDRKQVVFARAAAVPAQDGLTSELSLHDVRGRRGRL
jgi:hypothetical protein